MLSIMTQEPLLSTLRDLPAEGSPSKGDQMITQLVLQNNHLEDIKLKMSINNELLIQISELLKEKAGSDFGSQVSPIRNKPFPSPIRRRFENYP
jgi:hypothetical protein